MSKSQHSLIFWCIDGSPNTIGEVTNTLAVFDQIYSYTSLIYLYSGLFHTITVSSFFMQFLMKGLQNSYYKIGSSLLGYRTPGVSLRRFGHVYDKLTC